jgi:DNA (cytosine-5)-methyltransferase 1
MKFGSVCSGIEAASVAWNKLGWSASWLAEIEPFPSAVLAHHYPDVPNLGDMTLLPAKILSGEIEAPDIFCGGTPCQAFSIAGNRESLDDARGNLSLTFCEIANAIDSVRDVPAIIFWENVPGVLNTKDNAFGCFLAGLAGEDGELKPAGKKWTNAGMVLGPKRAVAWRVLDAQYFGLAQRRKRVFVVASARDDFNPAEVLFEFDGLRRDTAPGRNSRETTTSDAQSGIGSGSNPETVTTSFTPSSFAQYSEGVGTLRANGGDLGGGSESIVTTYNKQRIGEYSTEDVASTCAARDYKDATDLVTYENFKTVYEMHAQDARVQNVGDVLPTMFATYGSGGGNIPVTYGIAENIINRQDHNGGNGIGSQEELQYTLNATGVHGIATMSDVAGTLDASYYKGQGSRQGGEREFVAQPIVLMDQGGSVMNVLTDGTVGTLRRETHGHEPSVLHPIPLNTMAVRRLTPTECERLQGFPDSYTQIPWRKKPAENCPDGPRYKALGNSWAVPVVAWIGERIAKEVAK